MINKDNLFSLDKNTLVNIINNYRQVLEFYSIPENYDPNPNNNNIKNIDLDKGYQAKYVIDLMDILYKQYEEEYQEQNIDVKQSIEDELSSLNLNDSESQENYESLLNTINKLQTKIFKNNV